MKLMQQEIKYGGKNPKFFDAEKFVKNILKEGFETMCDETNKNFENQIVLPPFYDEQLYKRGQKFFWNNIFAMFFGKLLGLMAGLSTPTVISIMKYYNRLCNPFEAYKGYSSKLDYMYIWYEMDFVPNSRMWCSIKKVRDYHNNSSKTTKCIGLGGINQRDMILAQFGMMGLIVTRSSQIGIHYSSEEELQAFIHVWRVIGYLLGIEDRFNICRESVQETKDICEVLIRKFFLPLIQKKNGDFIELCDAFIEGMWCVNPFLNTNAFLTVLYDILTDRTEEVNQKNRKTFMSLSYGAQTLTGFIKIVLWSLQSSLMKLCCNLFLNFSLWMMKVCPVLAYYKFGFNNSTIIK